eukprot:TRINITY_DN9125_c0_g1_i1.p1 TRINITY_DN9125_c0_g1~~TRINITY_DN9125_c0_g1_i1.p1  ORF type:complete len:374 (+),score=113.50 TRINITY_DN9125_c0_g1_i1:74-1123(+)
MRWAAALLLAAAPLAAHGGAAAYLTPEYIETFAVRLWTDYKQDYRRKWAGSGTEGSEDHSRFLLFQKNLKRASELNTANPEATFGFNAYSDWYPEEFTGVFGGEPYAGPTGDAAEPELQPTKSPPELDWRRKERVTHVKHQGNCSAGAVFAAVGVLEAAHAAGGSVLRPLSEQWVLSCVLNADGCDPTQAGRSSPEAVLSALAAHGGAPPSEESYAYEAFEGRSPPCDGAKGDRTAAPVARVHRLREEDKYLRRWLDQRGPFAAGVSIEDWQTYQDGVMAAICRPGAQPTHSVLVVGYGSHSKHKYWLAKNSWGSAWGEHGYLRLPRGQGCLLGPVSASLAEKQDAGEL